MEQNIRIRTKINEVNHDYQVLRRRALFRQKARLSKQDRLKRKHEAEIRRTIGIESYGYKARRQRKQDLHALFVGLGCIALVFSVLMWVTL